MIYFTEDEPLWSKGKTIEAQSMEQALALFLHEYGFEPYYIILKS